MDVSLVYTVFIRKVVSFPIFFCLLKVSMTKKIYKEGGGGGGGGGGGCLVVLNWLSQKLYANQFKI